MKRIFFILFIFSACKTNHAAYTFREDKSGEIGNSTSDKWQGSTIFIYDTVGEAKWLKPLPGVIYGRNDYGKWQTSGDEIVSPDLYIYDVNKVLKFSGDSLAYHADLIDTLIAFGSDGKSYWTSDRVGITYGSAQLIQTTIWTK